MADPPIIGIDLGTTYSCVSVFQNGRTRIITVDNRSTIASCVVFTGDREIGNYVGHEAKEKMYKHPPKDAVFDAKRMLGRRYDDPSLTGFKSKWPFSIHESREHTIKLQVPDLDGRQQLLPPEEVSCIVLEALVEAVHQSLGVRPVEAIITVPAYFKEPQRDATKDAAILAGLTVRRLVNEPTAAAIAYGLEDPKSEERKVLVFDLGGGTFDISLLKMRGKDITTLATAGNDQLGGNDFDQRVLEWLIEELLKDFPGTPVGADTPVVARIRAQIEKAKVAVNKAHGRAEKTILVPDAVGTSDFRRVLTTEKFRELNEDLFQLCFRGDSDGKGGLDELFGRNGVGGEFNKDDIDEILTVGGSTNIPRIRELLQAYFNGKPLNLSMSADEAVARGAAALTTILDADAYEEGGGGQIVDVCSHSYGIELCSGKLDRIIKKNSRLPAYVDLDHYTTVDTKSTEVEILVYQGEYEERAADNRNTYIDKLVLTGIRQPGGGRKPKLRIMMELDENSLLNVKAEDITPGSRARPVTAKFTVREGRMPVEDRRNRAAERHAERMEKSWDNFVLD